MMGCSALFLKQFMTNLFLCLVFFEIECSDIKFDHNLKGKQLTFINDVGISGIYEFGTLNANDVCDNKCNNGGACYNNKCICLPGTSGPLCDIINGCNDLNCSRNGNSATCEFDKRNFRAFCKCQSRQEFDYDENKCKDCLCNDCKNQDFCSASRKCEFIRGEKACTCAQPSYKLNPKKKICESCSCGDNAEDCYFDDDGNQQCKCKNKYTQRGRSCEKCECYRGYGCKFVNYEKVCTCPSGYTQDSGDCYECKCGEHGKCVWGPWHESRPCNCDPGYMEIDGVCRDIAECYCGENSTCTIENNKKNCKCQEGFTYVNGLCADINECDAPKTCPENMVCFNLIGNYSCSCAKGFQPSTLKDGECEDIDECKNPNSCSSYDTECFNTVGSFACICKPGYVTRDGIAPNPICENKSSWKLGFGLLIGVFAIIMFGLIFLIYRKS